MWIEDYLPFKHLCEACGSRFLAIKFVSEISRRLVHSKYNWSIESRLISWAITGEKPPIGIREDVDPEIREIEDFLVYIDNDIIKFSVIDSYRNSVRNHHLVYNYLPGLNEYEQTRVRVLTRMIWYCYT